LGWFAVGYLIHAGVDDWSDVRARHVREWTATLLGRHAADGGGGGSQVGMRREWRLAGINPMFRRAMTPAGRPALGQPSCSGPRVRLKVFPGPGMSRLSTGVRRPQPCIGGIV